MDYAELAENRVITEEALSPYYDLLIEYDWPNHDDHMLWVATVPIADLVAWAEGIRRDEADEAEEEPFKYERAVQVTITLYPGQLAAVDMLKACRRHRGKRSPAVQEIIDWYIERAKKEGLSPRDRITDALYDTFCGLFHPDTWEQLKSEFMGRL